MKITNFLMVLTFFILTACGGDENIVNPDATLVGTWELEEFTAKIETTTAFSGETMELTLDLAGKDIDYQLVFSETGYTTEGSYGYEGNMDINGDKSFLDESLSNVSGDGTYTLEGDEITSEGAFFDFEFEGMTFDVAQGEVKAKITKLSDKELIFTDMQEEIVEQSQGGVSIVVTSKQETKSVWKRK